jgi:hypothetical protein
MPSETDGNLPRLRATHYERTVRDLRAYLRQLEQAADPDLATFDLQRANLILAGLLNGRGIDTSDDYGATIAALVGDPSGFRPDRTRAWIEAVSDRSAANLNQTINGDLFSTLLEDDPQAAQQTLWERYGNVRTLVWATAITTTFAMFGAHEGAWGGGARSKRWRVTSGNPRDSHAALDGQEVPMGETFSNGLRWPGDPGPAGEVANCRCALVFLGDD